MHFRDLAKSFSKMALASLILVSLVSSNVLGVTLSIADSLPAHLDTQMATPKTLVSDSVIALSAGIYHTCALTGNGGVKCWGSNNSGELGDGTTIQRSTPVDVKGLTHDVIAIAAGAAHTCAVTNAGGVKCWGNNGQGQLGDGTTTERLTPVDVNGLSSGVIAVAAGYHHTCAVTTTGAVKCWGSNSDGQLGDGSVIRRLTPVDVTGLSSGVAAISTGNIHTCALTTGGGIKCWGWNFFGQLGDGSTTQRLTPVDVTGLVSGASDLLTGDIHTCALTTAGGVKCWGDNGSGQLGDGTTTQSSTPVDVSGLTSGIAELATTSSSFHSCAVTDVGGVKCWGDNGSGQLGDGTTTQRRAPVDVTGLTNGVIGLASGRDQTCAMVNSSTRMIKCWGGNDYGQLGDSSTTQRTAPVNVVGWTTVSAIPVSGGLLHALGADLEFGNTFTATAIVTHTVLPASSVSTTGDLHGIDYFYHVTAVYSDTGQIAQPALGQTYTVRVQYGDGDRSATIEDTIKLYYWNGSMWVAEATSQVNTATNMVIATPSHLSTWAVLGETRRIFLPVISKQ